MQTKVITIERVAHCENEDGSECGLGAYWFTCPCCKHYQQNFELWHMFECNDEMNEFDCNKCKIKFRHLKTKTYNKILIEYV